MRSNLHQSKQSGERITQSETGVLQEVLQEVLQKALQEEEVLQEVLRVPQKVLQEGEVLQKVLQSPEGSQGGSPGRGGSPEGSPVARRFSRVVLESPGRFSRLQGGSPGRGALQEVL